jgi:hypothetical protein
MTDFQILYIWLILSIAFFIGLMLSMIREVVPVHYGVDIEPRHQSGEAVSTGRYFLEEGLLTGGASRSVQPASTILLDGACSAQRSSSRC